MMWTLTVKYLVNILSAYEYYEILQNLSVEIRLVRKSFLANDTVRGGNRRLSYVLHGIQMLLQREFFKHIPYRCNQYLEIIRQQGYSWKISIMIPTLR